MIWENVSQGIQKFRRDHEIDTPKIHMVLGSGLASGLEVHSKILEQEFRLRALGDLNFSEIEGFHATSAPGHKGIYRHYDLSGIGICFQIGRLHGYEGLPAQVAVTPVAAAALAGTKNFILTNAAGGLKKDWGIGTIMMLQDHMNMTGQNPLAGPNPRVHGKELGPRFQDMSFPYDQDWNERLAKEIRHAGLRVEKGVYVGLLGPSFETPAEVAFYANAGMGAVGMSTVWETITLKYLNRNVFGCSVISNPGAGLISGTIDHHSVLEEMEKVTLPFLRGCLKAIQSNANQL